MRTNDGRRTHTIRWLQVHAVLMTVVLAMLLGASAPPITAQEVIELPGEDRMLDPGLEEIYRLGSVTGERWDVFGRVAGLGFDGAGNLYILDTQAVRISVVDPEGNLTRQFIGEGEGPGEFGSNYAAALEFAVMRDGRVAVYDPGRMGFALFEADGTFARTVPFGGSVSQVPMIGGMRAFPGMQRVLSTTEVRYLSTSRTDPDTEAPATRVRYVLSYDVGGDQVRTDSVARGWKAAGDPDGPPGGFWPSLRADVLPDGGAVYFDSTTYAVKLVGPGGRLTRILTRPLRPRPVTDRIRTEEIDRQLGDLGSEPAQDAMQQAMIEFQRAQLESMDFYHEVPVLLALRTSWEGTIWIRRRGEEGEGGNPIDLITADARYLGTFAPGAMELPRAFGPNGLAAFVETDDLDVSYVVVKRLPDGVR